MNIWKHGPEHLEYGQSPSVDDIIQIWIVSSSKKHILQSLFIRQLMLWTFIHSFNRYLLSPYHRPGVMQGAGDAMVGKKDRITAFNELIFQRGMQIEIKYRITNCSKSWRRGSKPQRDRSSANISLLGSGKSQTLFSLLS